MPSKFVLTLRLGDGVNTGEDVAQQLEDLAQRMRSRHGDEQLGVRAEISGNMAREGAAVGIWSVKL